MDQVLIRNIDVAKNGEFNLKIFKSSQALTEEEKIYKSLEYKEKFNISERKWLQLSKLNKKIFSEKDYLGIGVY